MTDPKSLVESTIKNLAQDSPDELAKRAMNAHKSQIMRMCFCGHNFGKHCADSPDQIELFTAYRGVSPSASQIESNACAFCACENFEHIKAVSEPCKCGHEKRHHEEVTTPFGHKILKCKFKGCKTRCSYFRAASKPREVTPAEMKALVKKGKDKEDAKRYDPLASLKAHREKLARGEYD